MNKYFILISILISTLAAIGQEVVTYNNHSYYYLKKKGNNKLLIYLHGGLSNPIFKENPLVELDFLVEDNPYFMDVFQNKGYDLLLPITSDSLDWINSPKFVFEELSGFINQSNMNYKSKYISGFSDGGTGSYKIFYTNPTFFDGVFIFNGYPMHHNFYETVDYSIVNDKIIFFTSTKKDKRIPYEFLLTEYLKQKKYNAKTYLMIEKGKHTFAAYDSLFFENMCDLLENDTGNDNTVPLHGLTIGNTIVKVYKYRKKVYRKYRFGEEEMIENKKQVRFLKKNTKFKILKRDSNAVIIEGNSGTQYKIRYDFNRFK